MAKELLYMDDIWIRYLTLPELSVEGFHFNETVFDVIAVTTRLVGVVGADLSAFAAADAILPLKSSAVSKAAAAVAMIRRARV